MKTSSGVIGGVVTLVVLLVIPACGGGSHAASPTTSPPSSGASSSSKSPKTPKTSAPVAPDGTKAVSNGGLTIDVPATWSVVRPRSCVPATGPAVMVGSFGALQGCPFAIRLSGTLIAFGRGGPPFPPVPADHEQDATFHGITVQMFTDSAALSVDDSELLAWFPGRNEWLHALVPGSDLQTSLAQAYQVVDSVHATPGSTVAAAAAIHETFVGNWHVHDALLDITSPTTGVLIDSHGCADNCVEKDFLSLTVSQDGTRMEAVVSAVTYTDPTTGQPVVDTDTNPDDTGHIDDSFALEFIEPHLMLSIDNSHETAPSGLGSGNYYWCGVGLALPFTPACGA